MKRIKVEYSDLIEAFESDHPGLDYFLDKESGEVLKLSEDFCPDETASGIDYFSDPRYVEIPKISDERGLSIRRGYLDKIKNENLYDRLDQALIGRGYLKRFVDTLRAYPDYYKGWLEFKGKELKEEIMTWIKRLDIEVELIIRSGLDEIYSKDTYRVDN